MSHSPHRRPGSRFAKWFQQAGLPSLSRSHTCPPSPTSQLHPLPISVFAYIFSFTISLTFSMPTPSPIWMESEGRQDEAWESVWLVWPGQSCLRTPVGGWWPTWTAHCHLMEIVGLMPSEPRVPRLVWRLKTEVTIGVCLSLHLWPLSQQGIDHSAQYQLHNHFYGPGLPCKERIACILIRKKWHWVRSFTVQKWHGHIGPRHFDW